MSEIEFALSSYELTWDKDSSTLSEQGEGRGGEDGLFVTVLKNI
jgi:hypothetical protein